MSPSALVNATQAWVRHLTSCAACALAARTYGKQGERCAEGTALKTAQQDEIDRRRQV